jgi:hypothetical protein
MRPATCSHRLIPSACRRLDEDGRPVTSMRALMDERSTLARRLPPIPNVSDIHESVSWFGTRREAS